MIQIHPSGYCCYAMISGLYDYYPDMRKALIDTLSTSQPAFSVAKASPRTYRAHNYAMYTFVQGSDHPLKDWPYTLKLKALIEEQKLGTVTDGVVGLNIQHNYKPSILYIWVIDHAACYRWWQDNHNKP